MTDVWGDIYKSQWAGQASSYEIERDDGRVDRLPSAANYFESPREHVEASLLSRLEGPVLDIAAGAGSHTLFLQELGLDVVAAEFSDGARQVCAARGCRKVIPIDLRDLQLAPATYGSIIVMGNTIGAHQTLATFPALLTKLRSAVRPHGQLLFTMIDPTDTTDSSHLAYQQRNRERGQPAGLVRMRVKRGDMVSEWMHLLMLSADELRQATADTGWVLIDEHCRAPWWVRLYENRAS